MTHLHKLTSGSIYIQAHVGAIILISPKTFPSLQNMSVTTEYFQKPKISCEIDHVQVNENVCQLFWLCPFDYPGQLILHA